MAATFSYVFLRLILNLPPVSKVVPLSEALEPIQEGLSPATGIALTIPLGFLLYQIYYAGYSPLRIGGFVSADRGAHVLQYLTPDQQRLVRLAFHETFSRSGESAERARDAQLGDEWLAALAVTTNRLPTQSSRRPVFRWFNWLELKPPAGGWTKSQRKDAEEAYRSRWWTNYHVASALLDISTLGKDVTRVKDQWTTTSDVYHGLGATRTAVVAGVLCGLCADWTQIVLGRTGREIEDLCLTLVGSLLLVGATLVAVKGLNRVRRLSFESSVARLGYSLRLVFAMNPELLTQITRYEGGSHVD